jgi:hypothetical protein
MNTDENGFSLTRPSATLSHRMGEGRGEGGFILIRTTIIRVHAGKARIWSAVAKRSDETAFCTTRGSQKRCAPNAFGVPAAKSVVMPWPRRVDPCPSVVELNRCGFRRQQSRRPDRLKAGLRTGPLTSPACQPRAHRTMIRRSRRPATPRAMPARSGPSAISHFSARSW